MLSKCSSFICTYFKSCHFCYSAFGLFFTSGFPDSPTSYITLFPRALLEEEVEEEEERKEEEKEEEEEE